MIMAALIVLSLGFLSYSYLTQQSKTVVQAHREQVERREAQLLEKLTLIYWGRSGECIVANDGRLPIKIVKIYVDTKIISKDVTINPGQKWTWNIGPGSSLMVETDSGNLIKLREA